jgi:hypothetical protein
MQNQNGILCAVESVGKVLMMPFLSISDEISNEKVAKLSEFGHFNFKQMSILLRRIDRKNFFYRLISGNKFAQ